MQHALGIDFAWEESRDGIPRAVRTMSQAKYIDAICTRFGLEDAKPRKTMLPDNKEADRLTAEGPLLEGNKDTGAGDGGCTALAAKSDKTGYFISDGHTVTSSE